jgi:hypothetical protein
LSPVGFSPWPPATSPRQARRFRWQLTFTKPFTTSPAVTVTAKSLPGGPIVGEVLGAFSSTAITIGLRRVDGGEFVDTDFSFMAMGF